MRVIGGSFRGRRLTTAVGTGTRPTTDRVREAWASSVSSLAAEGFENMRVLDAFAGSGALGIEALSRGAAFCAFVDSSRRALLTLRENLSALKLDSSRAVVLGRDVFAPSTPRLLAAHGPYDLVILDPPYALDQSLLELLLQRLIQLCAVRSNTLITYERGNDAAVPLSLEMLSCREYGTTRLDYYICR
ncbi:MAG: 16S rRNA (guanine(966)-N(2))-methyltransferase RsmD [Coriobacteriales bacterium]|jgi:16S rRNA (guanine966-N2)-methyltransferase|nr:16S rRNA (guanine(966)-N(2))-methyltransferase RsmD [Coriobacteriales bacterium]